MPSEEELLAEMAETAEALRSAEQRVDDLRAARVKLWQQGRELDPPIPNGRMASASGVSEEAVLKAKRKAKAAQAAAQ